MKIEDGGVTAEFRAGNYAVYGPDPGTVVFTDEENNMVAVTVDLLRLAWQAWA